MLKIIIPPIELFDENRNMFINTKEYELQLEHSLVSVSKWESKWNKPFISTTNKTREEEIDYIRCMTITQNIDDQVYNYISKRELDLIASYISAPMTATTIKFSQEKVVKREVITSEIIYYWMILFSIPFECQRWHLNRLLMLINVCSIKNQPKTKMSRSELMSKQRSLNESRKLALKTSG